MDRTSGRKKELWMKDFFRMYIGQTFSLISSFAVQFAIIWWIASTSGSAISLSIATIVGILPQAILGPFAGVWIDRYNRKTIMILADSLVAVASAVLGLAFLFGEPSIVFVYIILMIRSIGNTFHTPAMQAAIPSLVPREALTRAAGLGQAVNSACNMISPMIGAFLISILPLGGVMLLDIIGAGAAILMLLTVKIKSIPKVMKKQSVLKDMKQGLMAIRENKVLVSVSVFIMLSSIIFIPIGSLLPLIVNQHFGGNAWHIGLSQTLYSLGMLVAAVAVGILKGKDRTFMTISLSIFVFGVCGFISGLLPVSAFWVFISLLFIMGVVNSISNIPYIAYIQKTIAKENLGKVLALVRSAMTFVMPIGLFVAGPLAEAIGVMNWLILAGILMIIVGIICWLVTRKYGNSSDEIVPQEV